MVRQKVAGKEGKPVEADPRREEEVGCGVDQEGVDVERRGRGAYTENSWLARRNQLENERKGVNGAVVKGVCGRVAVKVRDGVG